MIAAQTIFGLSTERRHDRRVLVVGYCGFMLVFLLLGLVWTRGFLFGNLAGTFLIAGGLGGIRGGGPVKRFSGREIAADDLTTTTASFPVQVLNLEGQLPAADKAVMLDERETGERDRAHFTAFRMLRWVVLPLCVLLGLLLEVNPHLAHIYGPAVLWVIALLVLSLPQLVLLWTEPDGLE